MVDEYTDYIYSLAIKTLRNVADAEEVVNDVLMKVIQKINDLNEGTSIKSWIYAITYRSCIDKIRARKTFDEINQNEQDEFQQERIICLNIVIMYFELHFFFIVVNCIDFF